jgi:hypothetical protein
LVDLRGKPEAEREDAVVANRAHGFVEPLEQRLLRFQRSRRLAMSLHVPVAVDETGEDLRPAEVDSDHAFVHRRRIT